MRKLFVTAAATAGLTLAAATAAAQVLPPAPPARPPVPPAATAPGPAAPAPVPVGIAAHHARAQHDPLLSGPASDGSAEAQATGALRVLLGDRGFGPDVTAGPMTVAAPGRVSAFDFATDDDLDAGLGAVEPEAWLVRTEAGRWWLWEDGACAPADRRAQAHEDLARALARAEGRAAD
jgi:hypothetical protein